MKHSYNRYECFMENNNIIRKRFAAVNLKKRYLASSNLYLFFRKTVEALDKLPDTQNIQK